MEAIDVFLAAIRSKLLNNPHYQAIRLVSSDGVEEVLSLSHNPINHCSSASINNNIAFLNNTIEGIQQQIQQLQLILQQKQLEALNTANTDADADVNLTTNINAVPDIPLPQPQGQLDTIVLHTATDSTTIPIISPSYTEPLFPLESSAPATAIKTRSRTISSLPNTDSSTSTVNNNTDNKRRRQSTQRFKPGDSTITKSKRLKSNKSKSKSQHNNESETESVAESTINSEYQEIHDLAERFRDSYVLKQNTSLGTNFWDDINKVAPQLLESTNDLSQSKKACAEQLKSPELAMGICSLISNGSTVKMLGYYFRSVLAYKLKTVLAHGEYTKQIKLLLHVSSPSDIAALPSLFTLIQQHYPNQTDTIESILTIPLFYTDISWREIRRFTTKTFRYLIDGAITRFKQLIRPYQDWNELQLVEQFDQGSMGLGIRAKRDILLSDDNQLVCDLTRLNLPPVDVTCNNRDSNYCMEIKAEYSINLKDHWVGKINHLPHEECNLIMNEEGKLIQMKDIKAGEQLSFDYGPEYWVLSLTGLSYSEWLNGDKSLATSRMEIFREMHETVHDYTPLLNAIRHRLATDRIPNRTLLEYVPKSAKLEAVIVEICSHFEGLQEAKARKNKLANTNINLHNTTTLLSTAPASDSNSSPPESEPESESESESDTGSINSLPDTNSNSATIDSEEIDSSGSSIESSVCEWQNDSNSTEATIRSSYRKAALLLHPDKQPAGSALQAVAAEKFKYLIRQFDLYKNQSESVA